MKKEGLNTPQVFHGNMPNGSINVSRETAEAAQPGTLN